MEKLDTQVVYKIIENVTYEIERTFNTEKDVKDIIENVVISNIK